MTESPNTDSHGHIDSVELPDGTTIWASSFPTDGYSRATTPDFGLYFDAAWAPPWPHAHVDWPDFGLPVDRDGTLIALDDVLARARSGQVIDIGCLGGHGRTGTALGCLALLASRTETLLHPLADPVEWVRTNYCPRAIETDAQAEFVRELLN